MFTLRTQNLIWTGGYGLLIVLIGACGVLLLRSPASSAVDVRRTNRRPSTPDPARALELLAAVPQDS